MDPFQELIVRGTENIKTKKNEQDAFLSILKRKKQEEGNPISLSKNKIINIINLPFKCTQNTFVSTNKKYFSCANENTFLVINLETNHMKQHIFEDTITGLCLNKDNDLLCVCTKSLLTVINAESKDLNQDFVYRSVFYNGLIGVSWRNSFNHQLFCYGKGFVEFFDIYTDKPSTILYTQSIPFCSFSSDGKNLFCLDQEEKICKINLEESFNDVDFNSEKIENEKILFAFFSKKYFISVIENGEKSLIFYDISNMKTHIKTKSFENSFSKNLNNFSYDEENMVLFLSSEESSFVCSISGFDSELIFSKIRLDTKPSLFSPSNKKSNLFWTIKENSLILHEIMINETKKKGISTFLMSDLKKEISLSSNENKEIIENSSSIEKKLLDLRTDENKNLKDEKLCLEIEKIIVKTTETTFEEKVIPAVQSAVKTMMKQISEAFKKDLTLTQKNLVSGCEKTLEENKGIFADEIENINKKLDCVLKEIDDLKTLSENIKENYKKQPSTRDLIEELKENLKTDKRKAIKKLLEKGKEECFVWLCENTDPVPILESQVDKTDKIKMLSFLSNIILKKNEKAVEWISEIVQTIDCVTKEEERLILLNLSDSLFYFSSELKKGILKREILVLLRLISEITK